MSCCWLGLLLLAGNQICSAANPSLRSRNLIIGGSQAKDNRFPYFVALKDADREIQCGGTLIAPDIVLTAAHCRNSNLKWADVGKYSNEEGKDFSEEIEILNPLEMMTSGGGTWSTIEKLETANATILDPTGFIHPKHDLFKRTYDVMLMKLARPASPERPLVKINTDPNIPVKQPGGKNEITIIGMGNIENTGAWPKPDTLKQVHVDFLTYEECIDVENHNLDYKYELLPHMICTHGAGIYGERGQCYGDSGGPYILMGADDTGAQDVQVGLVSWAVNCANPVFPMVGSRTSESIPFIKEITCSMSVSPPEYLCAEENNDIGDDIQGRLNIPSNLAVKISVRIFADPFGHELKWKITDLYNETNIFAEAPYGRIKGDHSFQDVIVPAGGNLKFQIDDAADDGIFGNEDAILYEVVLVDPSGELVMVEGNGNFGTSRQENFRVPQLSDEYLALVRASKVDASIEALQPVTGATATMKLNLVFNEYHEDGYWKVTSLDGNTIYAQAGPNSYRYGSVVNEEFQLNAGTFKLTIGDRSGTDEYRAFNSYELSYPIRNGGFGEEIVVEGGGIFLGEEISHNFTIPDDATVNTASLTTPGVVITDPGFLEEAQIQLQPAEAALEVESRVEAENCSPGRGTVGENGSCTVHRDCCRGLCTRLFCKDHSAVPAQSAVSASRVKGYGGAGRGRGFD